MVLDTSNGLYLSPLLLVIEVFCEDKSFGGVTFDIIFCMSHFNHVPSGDTLHRDTISSCVYIGYIASLLC